MLFLQFMLYSSSFVGTLKNKTPEAALELCQLKIKQLSPDILKFRTKHEDNLFTLICSVVSRSFLFIFYAGSPGLGSNNFRNTSYKEKTAGSTRVSRLSPFLMTMMQLIYNMFNMFNLLFHCHSIYIERKWLLLRNLARTSPSKSKLSGKFQFFNAIGGSNKMLKNSWIYKN